MRQTISSKYPWVLSLLIAAVVFFHAPPAADAFLTYVEMKQDGVDGVDGLYGARGVTVSPDGANVYVTSLFEDALAVFARNAVTGRLTYLEVHKDGVNGVDGLAGARLVTVSPDGKNVYVAGNGDRAVPIFSRDQVDGTLTYQGMVQNGIGSTDGLDAVYSVRVSPDGKNLYTGSYNDDAVAVFNRDASTGALTFLEVHQDGVNGVDGLDGTYHAFVSPDGEHVYSCSDLDDAVAVFDRELATGRLTFIEFYQDGVNGVTGLQVGKVVVVSPDGKHVYSVSYSPGALAVFSRNASTGKLSFIESHTGSALGLDGAYSVDVSPNGKYVYTSGGDTVSVFERDPTTGQLSFIEYQQDGVNGVDGLYTADSVAVSPDGNHVYATGSLEDAVVLFSVPQYTVTAGVSPSGSGTVSGPGVNCPGDCDEAYSVGTDVVLTAVPGSGYVFDHWGGGLTGTANPATVTMDADKTATAYFVPGVYTLTIPAGSTVADYRIYSMPLAPLDPRPSAVLGSQIGTYDSTLMRIGYWNAALQAYQEYPFSDSIEPGEAGWFLFRNGKSLALEGGPTPTDIGPMGLEGYCVEIGPGWNLVGNPFQQTIDVAELIVEEQDGSYEYLTSSANTITQQVFWVYSGGRYGPAYTLAVAQGGWIKKLTPGWGYVFFPTGQAIPDRASEPMIVPDDLERPPAPPTGLDSPSGGSGGGGGGCFVTTAAD